VTTGALHLDVAGDLELEGDETLFVRLRNPVGATLSTSASEATGTIVNDDTTPVVSISDVMVAEDAGSAAFAVTLSRPQGEVVTVDWATDAGTASTDDFSAASGSVQFTLGQTTATVTVALTQDALDEDDELFTVTLSNPMGASLGDGTGKAIITDDDEPPSVELELGQLLVLESAGQAVVNARLSAPSGKQVRVDRGTLAQTASASDFTEVASSTLTFRPGDTTLPVSVALANDTVHEAGEDFVVQLFSPGLLNATLGARAACQVTINDDDVLTVAVPAASVTEGNTGSSATLSVSITLSRPSALPHTVTYSTPMGQGTAARNVDFTPVSGSVTFAPGETSKTIPITVAGDTLDELDETIVLALSSMSLTTPASVTATIVDDDPMPTISVASVTVVEGNAGGGGVAGLALTLSAPSGRPVTMNVTTVNVTATAGVDYGAWSSSITLNAGATVGNLTVGIQGDNTYEPNETFTVNFTNATRGSLSATVTILNDDPVP
jgi:hypothetical protein